MSKRQSGAIRNANRMLDDRLWDDAGREWRRLERSLSRDRGAEMLADPAVRVAIHDDFGLPVRWVESSERQTVWRTQVEPEFATRKVQPPNISRCRYSRTRAFEASSWRSGDDEMVVFGWD